MWCSLFVQTVYFRLLNFHLSKLLSCCSLKISNLKRQRLVCYSIGFYPIGMDSDKLVYVLLPAWVFEGLCYNVCLYKFSPMSQCMKVWFFACQISPLVAKQACSESNPVQSTRSKSTTCPRKGRLLRFESNSAVTSDGGAQKLGNNVRRNSESIATKLCSQIGRKWNAMFESHVVTSVDRTSFDFRFEDFLSNLPL